MYDTEPPVPATSKQLDYITGLVESRFEHWSDAPPELQRFLPRPDMTIRQASRAIDVWKAVPTIWQRGEHPLQIAQRRKADHLWGKDGVSEDVIVGRWDSALSPYFEIRREVTGRHFTGQSLRIDRLLKPRGWNWQCGHEHWVGLEVKRWKTSGTSAYAQAADYASTTWDGIDTDNGLVIVGLHVADKEEALHLRPMGCFGFHVGLGRLWNPDSVEPDLEIYWGGSRMWSGSTDPYFDPAIKMTHRWCPRRKFGSR